MSEKKDIQAEFLELLNDVLVQLSNYARSMTKTTEEAKDLMSETVLIAYENFHKLRKKESFKYFLFTIASRLIFKRKLRKRLFLDYDERYGNNLSASETAPDVLMDVKILYEAMRKLPSKQYEAIVLFEISGFSIEEISKIQGVTQSGVKSRLKRAREKLKTLLEVEKSEKVNGTPNKTLHFEFFKNDFQKFYDKEIL
ncbi:MAG: RNA polymerase sigma factor [Candidatus Kapabacteria bacterium]|nr:RNA polymerase sigma factor [Candidatus Kapabacteria bacterium]